MGTDAAFPAPPSRRRLVLYLVFLATALPEGITGATPPWAWINPIQVGLILWLYGSGVLVCRELMVRWKTGWSGLLLLGAAYAIVEEGFTVKTFFDPTLTMLGPLAWYGRWAGVNWVWAVWLMVFHAAFSIAFPIFLVEWRWPAIRGQALLTKRQFGLALALLAGVAVFGFLLLTPYRPGPFEVVWGLGTIAFLAWVARGHAPAIWEGLPSGRAPSPRSYGLAGFLFFGLSFLVYAGGPTFGGHPAITYAQGGTLVLAAVLLVRRTVGQGNSERRLLAFLLGSMWTFVVWLVLISLTGVPGFLISAGGFAAFALWIQKRDRVTASSASKPTQVQNG